MSLKSWWFFIAPPCVLGAAFGPALVVLGFVCAGPAAVVGGILATLTVTPLLIGLLRTLREDAQKAHRLAERGVPGSAEIVGIESYDYDGESRHRLTLRVTGPGSTSWTSSLPTGMAGLSLGDRIPVIVDVETGDVGFW